MTGSIAPVAGSVISGPDAQAAIWFLGALAQVRVSGEQTGGAFALADPLAQRGNASPVHVHDRDDETFFVLDGAIEYQIGDPVTHRVTLNKWDPLSCPPRMYRGFRNVGDGDAVLLTVITGVVEARDDVSVPQSVGDQLQREHGDKVLDAFKALLRFDPRTAA